MRSYNTGTSMVVCLLNMGRNQINRLLLCVGTQAPALTAFAVLQCSKFWGVSQLKSDYELFKQTLV